VKFIGQYIQSFIARFRNDVYLEDISSGTIASGGNLGLDSDNKIVKQADTGITDLHGAGVDGSNNQLLTDDGDGTVTSESNLTFDGDVLTVTGDLTVNGDAVTFQSANADDPQVIIKNTTNDNQAARLQLHKDRGAAMADNDRIAEIDFIGEDASQNAQGYGKIICQALESDHGVETGKIRFQVAEYNGALTDGLQLLGQDADGEIDVTLGAGAASTTTIAGTLTMGSTAAMTNAGLVAVANQSNITGLGTISSGTWQGTAIASAYLDSDTAHLSGTQVFTGIKSFECALGSKLVVDGAGSGQPGNGAAIHVDAIDWTDSITGAGGTTTMYNHVSIETPRLLADNASVTTTNAATLYIKGAPLAHTNQTITNSYSLWVNAGNVRFDSHVDIEGDVDINGTLEADAITVNGTALTSVCSPVAGHSSIATVGTIGTGVWQGTAIAHAYIGTDAIETDNIADAQVTVAKLHADAIQTSGESFADNDTSLMTSAAIDDKINTKYSTSYITFSVKTSSTHGTNYILLHGSGISGGLVSIDSGTDSATDFGTRNHEDAGGSTETCDVATTNLEQQIPIPETCKLMGFYATTTTTTNTGAAYDTGVAIWHMPEANVNWGASTAGTATLIHKSDSSMHAENTAHSGANRKKVQKVERMGGTAKTLAAGDIIVPSVFGETADQQITATITLVIATPIKTI